jgi:hypothetical protein
MQKSLFITYWNLSISQSSSQNLKNDVHIAAFTELMNDVHIPVWYSIDPYDAIPSNSMV